LKTTHKYLVGTAVLVLLLVAAMLYAAWAYRQIGQASDDRRNSSVVMELANEFSHSLLDADTGQHGYALTGLADYLVPYVAGRDSVGQRLEVLRQLTPRGKERAYLDTLAPLLDAKLLDMAKLVELRRSRDSTGLMSEINLGEGKRLMDSIRVEFDGYMGLLEAGRTIQQDR